jgi:hypothetical protein
MSLYIARVNKRKASGIVWVLFLTAYQKVQFNPQDYLNFLNIECFEVC